MKLKKANILLALLSIIIMLTSCDNVFEFSPYEANVKNANRNTTAKNLQLIKDIQVNSDTFKFAFVTDNHFHYNSLKTVIDDINRRNEILFVLFGGDITHQGLLKEYQIFHDILRNLHKPYLTVIGNHDYLSNGELVYKQMFGDYNYSFDFNNNKFVIFDDVVWESNKNPDFDWLSTQLYDNQLFNQVIVIAHIPPFSDPFDNDMEQKYKSIMQENNVQLSMHGHVHSYSFERVYDDSVSYLTVPDLKEPIYCIINVYNKSFDFELKEL